MKSSILTPIILALVPRSATASHELGSVDVTVISNQTLSMITEFNRTNQAVRDQQHADELNITVPELINARLIMQFDVCFDQNYCPLVTANTDLFKSTFETHVCKRYCNQLQYHAVVEVLDVCDGSSSNPNYPSHKCIDFGLTIQAASKPEAEDIKTALEGNIAASKSAWRDLLHELAPQFTPDVSDTDTVGWHISEKPDQTWYPAWDKGHERCSNDANVPFYMKLDPDEYLAPTMTDCCRKHYWWNVRECAEPENRPCPDGWVPTA